MKKIFILVLLSFVTFYFSNAEWMGWKRLIDKPTFDIAANPQNWNTLFAGGEGRIVYRSYDGGKTWDTLAIRYKLGSVIFNNVILNPVDTNIVLVGGLKFGEVDRTTNQGKTWDIVLLTNGIMELNGKSIMFKPGSPDTAYLGEYRTGVVYRTTNKGASWDSISQVMTMRKYWINDTTQIDTLMSVTVGSTGIREDSTNILFVGTTTGEMFMSTDGGFNWRMTDVISRPDSDWTDCEITRITFSERDYKTGYAVITYLFPKNTNNGGLFKTTDGGYKWHEVAFHDTSLWAVAVRPYGQTDEVFVGGYTEDFYAHDTSKVPGVGIVRRSQDGGNSWWVYDPHIDWALKDPTSNADMNSVYFRPKSDTGYICGLYGCCYKSTDGGENWSSLLFPYKVDLNDIMFVDNQFGFVCGEYGFFARSKKGGYSWESLNTGFSDNLTTLYFFDNINGIAAGDNGLIISTADSGKTWNKINTGISDRIDKIYFKDASNGFACGGNGAFLVTTDGGKVWNSKTSGTNNELTSIALSGDVVYVVGVNGYLAKSTDNGDSWVQLTTGYNYDFNSIAFSDGAAGNAIIAASGGLILKTTDAGQTWNKIRSNTYRALKSVSFSSDTLGAIVGKYSVLLKTGDGGNNWDIKMWGSGPWANMWSLRFWGPAGQEKLYMASEAGLFVLENPSLVERLKENDANTKFKVIPMPDKSFLINYECEGCSDETPVLLRLTDINGRIIYEKSYTGTDIISDNIMLHSLPTGVVFFTMYDGNRVTTQKIIIE